LNLLREFEFIRENGKNIFFVYPSRRLGISSPREAWCISSAPVGLDLITRQRASCLRLDDIPQQVADDIQGLCLDLFTIA